MRRVSLGLVLAVVATMAAGCSMKSSKTPASSGTKKGVAGQYYYVNLFIPPVGGIVSSDIGGISCGAASVTVNNAVTPPQYVSAYYSTGPGQSSSACGQTRYEWAQQVVLTATPRDGNAFIGWAGDCQGTGTCTLAAGADKTVVAIFGPPGGGHGNLLQPALHGPAYIAFRTGVAGSLQCTSCHGATLGGQGIAPSCNDCHAAAGFPDWLNTCTFCHSNPPAAPHAQNDNCGTCHTGYSKTGPASGTVNAATHMNGHVDLAGATCTTCHGTNGVNAAPPADTLGRTATTFASVGAHQAHVAATLSTPIACAQCHGAASASYSTTHSDGIVQVGGALFGALANQGTSTIWNAGSASCAASYCHGGTTALAGGTATTPVWTTVDGSQKGCTSCHGSPPPAPHAQSDNCGTCHPGYSKTGPTTGTVNPATHVNGSVQVVAQSCTTCHGTAGVNAAPPADTQGRTATTFASVGAHQAHVAATLSTPIACTQCHGAASASYSTTHADGTVQVGGAYFGALANQGTSTIWNAGSASCAASYCHGGSSALAGGTATTPVWTTVDGSQKGCTSCHGSPPPAPHLQRDDCGTCHPGYSKTGPTTGTVNAATHVNGSVQVVGLTCTSCHGDPLRSADPTLAAMPPTGTGGQTLATQRGVGAHAAHLTAGSLSSAFACTDCHNPPTSTSHATGAVQFSWSSLARGGGTPAFNPTDASCATVYCHGNFPGGITTNAPIWTAAGTGAACGSCHALPPPAPHSASTACGSCHGAGYSLTTVNPATHVNGIVEQITLTCTTCHGTTGVNAAPPADTTGHVATNLVSVGAHQAHVAATLSTPIACTQCHGAASGSYSTTHADGTVQVGGANFGALANQGTTTVWNGASCAASYCHGGTSALTGGTATAPLWTTVDGSQKGCASCHGSPPPAPHAQRDDCGTCHPGYSKTGATTGTVNAATHVNGSVEVVAMSCTTCHGDANLGAVVGADANVKAAPPADTHANTATTARGVGVHQVHVNGTRSKPVACAECHGSLAGYTSTHANGATPIAFGTLGSASGAVFNGDLTCSSTYCHGNFSGGNGAAATPAWTTAGTLGCTACHGSPPAAPHLQRSDCGTCHPGYTSSAVVAATHIDGNVDLDPNLSCSTCHTSYAMAGTSSYHHVMGSDAQASSTYPTNNSPATSALADKNCLQCHVAHDKFGAGATLRTSITGTVTAASDDAGLCTSCHTNDQVKDQTRQLADNTARTAGWIDTSAWTAAQGVGHNYTVPGAFPAGSPAAGAFTANCVKCHNSGATQYQTGSAYSFSLHESADRRLRAPLGQASFADDKGEAFCYRCHSNVADAVGGTKKSTDLTDWYGAKAMPSGSTGVYAQMAKATANGGHNGGAYTGLHKPNPAEETLAYLAANKHTECSDCHDPHSSRRGNQSDSGTVTAAPVAPSTTTLSDSTMSWIPGTWVGFYVDITTGTGAGGRAQITANTATTLTFAPALTTAPAAGSLYRIAVKSAGGAVASATASTLTDSGSAVGGTKAWRTNAYAGWTVSIVLGTGVGQAYTIASNTTNQLTINGTWATTPTTTSRYVISKLPNVMLGASGVNVTSWGSASPAWGTANTFAPAAGSATPLTDARTQWQVCFKCHSAANTSLATWKSTWSNLAQDFNPNNQSYHPVIAPAVAAAATGIGNTQLTTSQVTNGWKPGDVMFCSDCHGNDDTSGAASQGPHASAVKFILRGTNLRWPFQADGTTRWTVNNSTTGVGTAAGLFCRNCHPALTGVHTARSNHQSLACVQCHLLIPHGGKVKRLIRTTNTPIPYADTGVAASLRAYSGGTNSSACGASCTTAHGLAATTTNSW